MSDEPEQSQANESEDAPEDALGDVLFEEHSGGDEDVSGLEMDDFQASEIRQIFLTTLPEYLEPVAEMLGQLLSGDASAGDVLKPLDTTLSSVATAASRVGIDDVADLLQRMRAAAARVDLASGPPSGEVRETLNDGLAQLRRIAGGGSEGVEPPVASPARTVVAAFKDIQGFDPSVLERLTAAGLVTVDQILMADPSEVVAVSGLGAEVIAELIRHLKASNSSPAAQEPREDDDAATSAQVPPSQALPDPRRDALLRCLREQVELEASLDDARVRAVRLSRRIALLREELLGEQERRGDLRRALQEGRELLAQRLVTLSASRNRHAKCQADLAARQHALAAAEARREQLGKLRDATAQEHQRISGEMAELLTALRRMVQAAAEPEQGPSGRSHGLDEPSARRLG